VDAAVAAERERLAVEELEQLRAVAKDAEAVAIVADIFMLEQENKVTLMVRGEWNYVRVWNPTVANISLMALGSSAPEIMLSVIELFSNGMHTGELWPSTIVGSAAFNMLISWRSASSRSPTARRARSSSSACTRALPSSTPRRGARSPSSTTTRPASCASRAPS
jgi:hypothetical protein